MGAMRPIAYRVFHVGYLRVEIYPSRQQVGQAASVDVASGMRQLLDRKSCLSMVFAAAPSQNEMLSGLRSMEGIDWRRVVAFHMDEYVGLPERAPQLFAEFLRTSLFDAVHPGHMHYLDGNALDLEQECARYTELLAQSPPDIVCLGVGENGHIAFNDPHEADFSDRRTVKVVALDETCRLQQVHDGCFSSIERVPLQALTLTIPALLSASYLHCVVPSASKAEAVRAMLEWPIETTRPASILRNHSSCTMYLDTESSALLSI